MQEITWEVVVGVLAVLGAVGGLWLRFEGKIVDVDAARKSTTDKMWDEFRRIEHDFADYKLFVERNHVSAAALKETEERLITAVEKLAARMETIDARLEKMSLDMISGKAAGRRTDA